MVATNLKAETMSLMDKRSALEAEMNVIIERLCQLDGPGLSGNLLDFEVKGILLTAYDLVRNNAKSLSGDYYFRDERSEDDVTWDYMILDEGFPRTDIDIPVVRADRHCLAELRSDHKLITERIDQNIQLLHSTRLASKSSPLVRSGNVEGSNFQDSPIVDVGTSASYHNVLSGNMMSAMDVDASVSIPFALVDEIAEDSPAAEDGLQLGDQIVKFGNVETGDNLLPKLASEAQSNQGRGISVVVLRQATLVNLTVTPRVWQGRGLLGCHFRML